MAKDHTFYEKQLIRIYEDIQKSLFHLAMNEVELGKSYEDTSTLMAQVNKVLNKYGVKLNDWALNAANQLYVESCLETYKEIKGANALLPDKEQMEKLHSKAIKLVTKNLKRTFDDSLNMIGRQQKSVYRELGLISTGKKFAYNMTYKEQSNYLNSMFTELGIDRVPYVKDPRRSMRIKPYSELISRTTTAEISNQGRIDEMIRLESYLVSLSVHHTPCKVCAKYENRVYRVVNKEEIPDHIPAQTVEYVLAFPHIREAIKQYPTYKTIHPNCRHRLNVYIIDLKPEETIKEDIKRSNKPFADNRTPEQVKRYEESQEKNRKRWVDRREYEKYEAAGMKVPSFSGFRLMKKYNSVSYKQLKLDYSGIDVFE